MRSCKGCEERWGKEQHGLKGVLGNCRVKWRRMNRGEKRMVVPN